uniref:Uncharacterized protein n=1 Tax=Wuchereria bancrofti TaxID=6293 RepID=A0A1I8EEM5_WUCBA
MLACLHCIISDYYPVIVKKEILTDVFDVRDENQKTKKYSSFLFDSNDMFLGNGVDIPSRIFTNCIISNFAAVLPIFFYLQNNTASKVFN